MLRPIVPIFEFKEGLVYGGAWQLGSCAKTDRNDTAAKIVVRVPLLGTPASTCTYVTCVAASRLDGVDHNDLNGLLSKYTEADIGKKALQCAVSGLIAELAEMAVQKQLLAYFLSSSRDSIELRLGYRAQLTTPIMPQYHSWPMYFSNDYDVMCPLDIMTYGGVNVHPLDRKNKIAAHRLQTLLAMEDKGKLNIEALKNMMTDWSI